MRGLVAVAAALFLSVVSAAGATPLDIAAPGPSGPLKGTLSGWAQGVPVVLILPGSGPTDRDGNSPLGIAAAPYKLLAQGLAARGVASVRVDKRGLFGSAAAVADADAVSIDDYVRDTGAWVAAIRARTRVPCVWLLGHSEGGLVALAAAVGGQAHVCGVILAAVPGRPVGDVLQRQVHAGSTDAALLRAADAAIAALSAGHRVDATALPPALLPLFRPRVQGFLISLFSLDPTELAGRVRKPMLILQGGRDLQVGVADAERLRAAAPDARMLLLARANHVFKDVPANDRAANLAAYADPNLPLAPGMAEGVAAFVLSEGRRVQSAP